MLSATKMRMINYIIKGNFLVTDKGKQADLIRSLFQLIWIKTFFRTDCTDLYLDHLTGIAVE